MKSTWDVERPSFLLKLEIRMCWPHRFRMTPRDSDLEQRSPRPDVAEMKDFCLSTTKPEFKAQPCCFPSCMSLGQLLDFSEPWFPHPCNSRDISTCFLGWQWRLHENLYLKTLHSNRNVLHPRVSVWCLTIQGISKSWKTHRCSEM